tara:strand:+ start:768 stop:3797 length:3030 start_codon:yes stop_codon:yes gene_type:complete
MQENFNDTNEQIESSFFPALFSFFKEEIAAQRKFISDASDIYSNFSSRLTGDSKRKEELRVIKEINNTNNHLYKLLTQYYPEKKENGFNDDFKNYISFCNEELKQIPEKITIEQKPERFTILESDSFSLKLKKPFKKLFFNFSQIPVKTADLFRKNKKGRKVWTHQIPVRSLYANYFEFQFPYSLLEEYTKLLSSRTNTIDKVWKIDQFINHQITDFSNEKLSLAELKTSVADRVRPEHFDEIYNTLDELLANLEREIRHKLQIHIKQYRHTFDRVGTMEVPYNKYSASNIETTSQNLHSNYLKLSNGWKNTLFAMLDDFQLDLELFNIVYNGLQQHNLLSDSCTTRIDTTIINQIDQIYTRLVDLNKVIESYSENEKVTLSDFLITEKTKLHLLLSEQIIPESVEQLYGQNIPYLIERLETKIKTEVDKIKSPRIISASAKYDRAFKKNELEHFDPKELVQLETYPDFVNNNKELKMKLVRRLEEVRTTISDISSIVAYNLDSAITYANDGKSFEEVRALSLEGMERSISKANEIKTNLTEISKLIITELKASIDELNKELDRLTKNENILNLRIQLAKAKAIKHTQNYRDIFFSYVNKGYIKIKALSYIYFEKGADLYKKLMKRFGLNEKEVAITPELADFLSDTEKAIQQLPYVYQRLYRVEPIEDDSFFVGRSSELERLNQNFQNWSTGKYSATIITGEKGSGSSTILNFFIKQNNITNRVLRSKLTTTISTNKDLFAFFNHFLQLNAHSEKELIEQLKSTYSNKIIILEDINFMFLKMVNGFEAMKTYFEILSKTGKCIYWINTCKLYAWQYLSKSLKIGSYYRNVIELQKLDEKQINRVIINRHRVSGYNIVFEQNELISSQSKFNRLTEPEKQEYLKTAFFKELNRFSDSNISIALLYWLRSTREVKDNTIYIGRLSGFDFSFLKNIETSSVLTLHSLIIHERLSLEEHAALFNQSIDQSRLNLITLEDRGIINRDENDSFSINQLLFRQVVNLLKNKNIIH